MNKKSRALVRPVRTAGQLVPAAVMTEFIDAWLYDMNDKQYGALLGLLLVIVSFIHNYTEQRRAPKDTALPSETFLG